MMYEYKMYITNSNQSIEMCNWVKENLDPNFRILNTLPGDTIIFRFSDEKAVAFKLRWL